MQSRPWHQVLDFYSSVVNDSLSLSTLFGFKVSSRSLIVFNFLMFVFMCLDVMYPRGVIIEAPMRDNV